MRDWKDASVSNVMQLLLGSFANEDRYRSEYDRSKFAGGSVALENGDLVGLAAATLLRASWTVACVSVIECMENRPFCQIVLDGSLDGLQAITH